MTFSYYKIFLALCNFQNTLLKKLYDDCGTMTLCTCYRIMASNIRIDYKHQLHARITKNHEIPSTSLRRDSLIYFSKGALREVVSDQRRSSFKDSERHCTAPCYFSPLLLFFLLFFIVLSRTETKTEKANESRNTRERIMYLCNTFLSPVKAMNE